MQEQSVFKLILNDKIFTIPSKFPSLSDVDPSILEILKTKKEYEVKSSVSYDNFQSFLDNWVNGEALDLNVDNFYDFDQLSQEFDRIKEHIQLFNNFYIREDARANKTLREKITKQKKKLQKRTIKYGQLIEYFTHKLKFDSYSNFLKIKDDLYETFEDEYVWKLDLYGRKEVIFQDMQYSIDLTDKTAFLLGNKNSKGDVFIPRSITFEGEEYVIKRVVNRVGWKGITSLHFAEDSEIDEFNSMSLGSISSSLTKIVIPPSVSVVASDSFHCLSLKSVEFSMSSKLKELCEGGFFAASIEKLVVPPSVTIIHDGAFYNCRGLKTIEISPNSQLKVIESLAFSHSTVEKIVLPSSIEVFENGWLCNLNCIEIFQNGVENLINYKDVFILGKSNLQNDEFDVLLFAQKNVEKVTIPSFVKRIGKNAFKGCQKLTKVDFEKDSKIEVIDSYAFRNSLIESISIPSSIVEFKDEWCDMTENLNNIQIIECENKNISLYKNKYLVAKSNPKKNDFDVLLFAPRNITTAIIPEFVKKIAPCAFQKCECLKKVEFVLNSKLIVIGQFAFESTAIESITIPCHVTKIGNSAFENCKFLKNVKFEKNSKLRIISKRTFCNTKIESIEIPSNIFMIKGDAFYGCINLEKVTFLSNSTLRTIGCSSFNSTAIESISIPSSVTLIKWNAFGNCENLRNVEFTENSKLRFIESSSFNDSSIKKILIPKHVIKIGMNAFENCKSLEKVEFHEKSELIKIDKTAFASSLIQSIIIPPCVTKIEDDVFINCERLESVFIPRNLKFKSIPNSFLSCSSIQEILIPQNITKIGECSFAKCYDLKTVNFSEKSQLKSIDRGAFKKSGIENISIPSCVENFENGWCKNIYYLINITINDSEIKNIQYYDDTFLLKKYSKSGIFNVLLFARRDLTKVVIPSFIIQIAPYAFQGSPYLTEIEFEKNSHLSEIENNAFANLNINKIVIPSSIKRIECEAFVDCDQLYSICFENNSQLEFIDPYAFKNTGITSFSIPASCIFISSRAFRNCYLGIVEIEENSKLQLFNVDAFDKYELLMVPCSLNHLIKPYLDL